MDIVMHDGVATPPTGSPSRAFLPSVSKDESNQEEKKPEIELVESTTLDLESYLANYSGHTKIIRLEFIGDYCPPLRIDAYTIALNELLQTMNTEAYLRIAKKLNEFLASKGKPAFTTDTEWVAKTHRAAATKQEKLDTELKNYKHNMIKESIRMGHNDLGDYFYQRGDLNSALKSYTRTRDYCTTSKHIITMCINVIKVGIEMNNYSYVLNYINKAEATPDLKDQNLIIAKLKAASALVQLEGKKYKAAARAFIETNFEIDTSFNEVISQQDIGTYGGLCALASFDRPDLKSKVIDNPGFKQFLELSPIVRRIIEDFYHSRYGSCLKNLDQIKNELLLDIHLHDHVKTLYEEIRKKALVQFFSPFQSVDLNKMAQTFNTTVQALEAELASLIMDNVIQGRIDSHNKVLYARQADQRSTTFEKALTTGDQYQRTTKALLLRVNMLKADFVVRSRTEVFKS